MRLSDYPQPSVATDVVIFTIKNKDLKVLLIKRKLDPFKGKWAIPGGFIGIDEPLDSAAKRELIEETGVDADYLEQLYTFGNPKRDPRGRVISVAYMALVNSEKIELKAASDASDAQWFSVNKIPDIGFDHKQILKYATKRLRWKFEYTTVAFSMLPDKFTMAQIKVVYDIVFNKKFDKRNFSKKILSLDILQEEGIDSDVSYRPPMLYSLKKGIGDIIEII